MSDNAGIPWAVRRPALRPTLRAGRVEDLPSCAEVWRAGLSDYGIRVGRPPMPPAFSPLLELLGHMLETDPDRFVVAVREESGAASVVAFGAAIVRGDVWFLGMLFVQPDEQGLGTGRRILDAILPAAGSGLTLATCTDSAQPISNALYSRYGMTPREPILELVGTPDPARLPRLPDGVTATAMAGDDAPDATTLAGILADVDRQTLGYEHPQDHGYLRRAGRPGYLYRETGGRVVGYGYVAQSGRVGPIAVLDPDLMPAAFGHLLRAVVPAGAFSAWVPGAASSAVRALLEAGLRIEDFPALLCWDRPFARFDRYLPITLAVL